MRSNSNTGSRAGLLPGMPDQAVQLDAAIKAKSHACEHDVSGLICLICQASQACIDSLTFVSLGRRTWVKSLQSELWMSHWTSPVSESEPGQLAHDTLAML